LGLLEKISSLIAFSSSESSNGFDNTLSAWDSVANASGYSPHPVIAITGMLGNFVLIIEIRPIPLIRGKTISVIPGHIRDDHFQVISILPSHQ